MKFKKGRVKDFENLDDYLKDVYKRNAAAINEVYGAGAEFKFVNRVKAGLIVGKKNNERFSVSQALSQLSNSEAFTPYSERAKDNLMNTLKDFGAKKQFTSMIRDAKGRFQKIDYSLLRWNRELMRYEYNNKVFISFKNSPVSVSIGLI